MYKPRNLTNKMQIIRGIVDNLKAKTMNYKPPAPNELKQLIHVQLGLSRSQSAQLADVASSKIGMWSAGKGQMPFSVLHTIINKTTGKDISQDNWRQEV